jgi:spore maturation protein CgeB
MHIVILGLSIRSSWGNGHATTYRALVRALSRRGHRVLFLERDVPWYANNCDVPVPRGADLRLYSSFDELRYRFSYPIRKADLVIVGSYTPEGIRIGEWITQSARGMTAFYDIDTPVTLRALANGGAEYICPELVSRYTLYLSFTGGPTLDRLREYGARSPQPLYCSVDPDEYFPSQMPDRWDLGYMGTYSSDRAAVFDRLLLQPARRWNDGRMIVAGPQYPSAMCWPQNVAHIDHIAPSRHREFYCSQRFTLNLTREPMKLAGYSPSVRLFEAASCGCAIISDRWDGLDTLFRLGEEVLIADSANHVLDYVQHMSEAERIEIGRRARARILAEHCADVRARQLETYVEQALEGL